MQALHDLVAGIPRLVSDRVTLLSLEMRRASGALAVVAGCAVAAAVFAATAWTALWIGVSMALVDAGMPRYWVAAVILLFNVVMTAVAVVWARSQVNLIALPATLRHLTVHQDDAPPTEQSGKSVAVAGHADA